MRTWLVALGFLAVTATTGMAAERPSVERGKELFNSSTLGTNGKSCAGCHAHTEWQGTMGAYDDGQLQLIINQCISKALGGMPLPLDSTDLVSLVMYLKSLITTAAK